MEGGGDARVSSLSVKNAVLHARTADDDDEDDEDISETSNFIRRIPFPSSLHPPTRLLLLLSLL